MCGRYSRSCETKAVVEAFGVDEVATDTLPAFNIGPGQDIAAIVGFRKRRLGTLRWGLKPGSGSPAVINARAETLARRPMFKGLLEHRRCLIPADGFFEWVNTDGVKRAYYFYRKDRRPFVFAGLWDRQDVCACVIVTCHGLPRGFGSRELHAQPGAGGRVLAAEKLAYSRLSR